MPVAWSRAKILDLKRPIGRSSPGMFKYRARTGAISSRNFAAFSPFHTYPTGRAAGNHWGPAVAMLKTASGSPFYFSFHHGDLGNTFICGPSGSGKTVVQNFLLSQAERLGATYVFFDKDRGAETLRTRRRRDLSGAPQRPCDRLRAAQGAGADAGEPVLPRRH